MSVLPAIDFHCHSHFSDGALSPMELLELAKARDVQQLAITDHDTVGAYALPLHASAASAGITLVTGCEISCQWQRRSIHVVGLNLDLASSDFGRAMTIQAQAREDRAEKITEVLQRLGFDVALPQVQALAGLGVVGRPHFAQHLVATGQIPSMTMAFKRVLGSGKPGDIKANWPTLETAVGWITDAGGIAVVAHPMKYNMTLTKLRALLSDFVAAGGQGLEVLTGYQDAQRINALADLAHRFDLYASAGSDFHQPGQPWAELGRVAALPDRCVPVWTLWS
ncbi:MAG: PHP domain-containing protein [Proteobacteria bacterium]|jgi:predicted metal-dependent phosphoesterase TrpH|nr:PHP domain-containing protein [Pseudomonadota bacterium]